MILKSLSRKSPSFTQLITYMDDEKADKNYELHRNCFSRGQTALAGEFYQNSTLLKSRKDGNYLYHEILSIDLKDGVERNHAKECLREIALHYAQKRCPRNMVYGTLHEDHRDHIHYHLLISANERESRTRYRITRKQFDTIKQELEAHVLSEYPELKQVAIATASRQEKKQSRKASDQKRRTGKLERKEQVRDTILQAIAQTQDIEAFIAHLATKNFSYYTRGKNYGVEVAHEDGKTIKYRFSGLGIHEAFEEFLMVTQTLSNAQEANDEQVDVSSEPTETDANHSETEVIHPEATDNIATGKSAFLQDMQEKRQKKFSKKSRKGKPRTK